MSAFDPADPRMPARFRAKFVVDEHGCWVWTAGKNRKGYGRFRFGVGSLSHRYAYEALRGPIPEGLQLDHLCRNRACCNPAHLEPVTNRENTVRGVGPAQMRDRMRGHTYTRGEKSGNASLTAEQIREIRDGYTGARGEQAALVRRYRISQTQMSRILLGKRWVHLSG